MGSWWLAPERGQCERGDDDDQAVTNELPSRAHGVTVGIGAGAVCRYPTIQVAAAATAAPIASFHPIVSAPTNADTTTEISPRAFIHESFFIEHSFRVCPV